MEQLFLLIQQIYRDLNILSNYSPEEREKLREGYFRFLDEIRDIIRALSRIIGGSTYWGWKVELRCQPWHLMTYRQQKGLTLQAGWEDKFDFGLDLYRYIPGVPQKVLTTIHSPEVLTPVDLDALEIRDIEVDLSTDVCKLSHIEHERPVLFHELIPSSSASSSSIENIDETLEIPVLDEESDVDSMPEFEDETNLDLVEIPLWLIPNGVMVTFRGGRVIFEREQGPPWQDVLTQMLEGTKLNVRR